jgi:hypothetical protein
MKSGFAVAAGCLVVMFMGEPGGAGKNPGRSCLTGARINGSRDRAEPARILYYEYVELLEDLPVPREKDCGDIGSGERTQKFEARRFRGFEFLKTNRSW